jgi:hypothetical protein
MVLVPSGQVSLPLDQTSSQHLRSQYLRDRAGTEYLILQNKHELRFYDLNTSQLAFTSKYAEEGPNGVGEAFSFYAVSLDSIFLKSPPFRIFLADTSGQVKRTYKLDGQKDQNGYPFLFYGTVSSMNEANVEGGRFHFLRWPDGFDKNLAVRKQPFLGELDLASGQLKILPAYYPAMFQTSHWPFIYAEVGIARAPNGFVFNFPGSDSIYAWQGGKSTTHYAASQHIGTPAKPLAASPATLEDLHRPIIEQPCYPALGNDPWRQVYYRIAWHPHDDLSLVNNLTRILAEKTCSIIVLDKDLNIIGETMLPRDRYFTKYWFIGPKGLYISDAHPDNPDLDEDVLSYTLFTLAKRKDE